MDHSSAEDDLSGDSNSDIEEFNVDVKFNVETFVNFWRKNVSKEIVEVEINLKYLFPGLRKRCYQELE